MRWGAVARNYLTLVALSALAFGGALFYLEHAGEPPEDRGGIDDTEATPASHGTQASQGAGIEFSGSGRNASFGAARSEAHASKSQWHPAHAEPDSAHSPLRLAPSDRNAGQMPPGATSSAEDAPQVDPVETDIVPTPDTLSALATTLREDTDTLQRVQAVDALSSLVEQGYEIDTIRDSLRLAAADEDKDVADHARDAYDELIQKEDSR